MNIIEISICSEKKSVAEFLDKLKEYLEPLFDKDDDNPPLLFVFGKDINEKLVYIKLKIKGKENRE